MKLNMADKDDLWRRSGKWKVLRSQLWYAVRRSPLTTTSTKETVRGNAQTGPGKPEIMGLDIGEPDESFKSPGSAS